MPRAFISHSSADDRYVQELDQFLRSLGFTDNFNDGHSIAPDDEFWRRIEEGILGCDAFVVVLTHTSVASYWVNREVEFARANGKRVIPVRIDDCKVPACFDGRDVIELRQGRGEKVKIAPSRILRHSPPVLFGRDAWLDALDEAWAVRDKLNVYTLVAWGGVGKTSLVAHWVGQRLAAKGWPGVERYFDWSFYSQGTGESRQTSSDLFISEALNFFGDPDPVKGSPWERGERLAGLIRQHRTLLVLDGIEPLQYPVNDPQAGRLRDLGLEALLQSLAADNPGLCVITTREHLKNVESFAMAKEKTLDKLPKDAGVALLRHVGVQGTDEELETVWKETGGHALTLQLLGRFLADAHGGDIRKRGEVHFEEIDAERQGRSAFKVMIAYDRWLESAGPERQRELAILRLTGLFDRPISPDCLKALRQPPAIPGLTKTLVSLSPPQWNMALKRLVDVDLVSQPELAPGQTASDLPIDAHPLIREYFAKQLREAQPDAFRTGHSRLFDHLCENTEHRPDTLEGLQPLYQAVLHGCLAGRHSEASEVYSVRILRGSSFYSTKRLGASGHNLAALASFFDEPWIRFSSSLSKEEQTFLLAEVSFHLHAVGRLAEALEPRRVSLEMQTEQECWVAASSNAGNLSVLESRLGRLQAAIATARRAVELADKGQHADSRVSTLACTANALHQSGDRTAALSLFMEAERTQQANRQWPFVLCGMSGFEYCDLLLTPLERNAWRCAMSTSGTYQEFAPAAVMLSSWAFPKGLGAEHRAGITLKWLKKNDGPLILIALDHLTLARFGVYRALLDRPLPQPTFVLPDVSDALLVLRAAGQFDEIPSGLLTSALYHHVRGESAASRRALDEAWQIAERGPMPLYLCDIHLHRARLFFRAKRYPWNKNPDGTRRRPADDLSAAEKIIDECGYHRRDEELADAKRVILGNSE